jgi:hypothetical protein
MAFRLDSAGEALKFSTTLTPFTVGGWAKLVTDKDTYACLWAWESGDPGSDTSAQVLLTTDNTGTALGVYDGTTLNAGVTVTAGTWFRWAVSIGATPFPMIGYLTTSATSATTVVNVGNISPTGLNRQLFGANSYSAEYWAGDLDDLWLVDSVLTQAQIENMWRQRRKNIVTYARWPAFNATKADALVDMSGNGRALTEIGTLAMVDGAPIGWGAKSKNLVSAGSSGATGTGALALSSLAIDGSGTMTSAGTGSLAMSPLAMDAAGAVGASGTGTIAMSSLAATGSGTQTITGTGSMALSSLGMSGSSTRDMVFTGGVFHYLGTPKRRAIRTMWALPVLSVADRNTFLTDCVNKGYTGVEFGAIWRDERTTGVPFANRGGILPFTHTLDASTYTGDLSYGDINDEAPDFETPNSTYWAYIKAIVDECESRGLLCHMFPSYVGHPVADPPQGWRLEMRANGAAKIEAFGEFVGSYFAGNGNIVWMLAGDQGTDPDLFDATDIALQEALYDGITSANGGSAMWSAEFRRNSTTQDVAELAALINYNMSYANSDNINVYTRQAYDENDQQVLLQEGPFDEEGTDGNSVNTDSTQPCRRYAIWSELSGGGGYTDGNGYVWLCNDTGSGDDWDQHLSTQTAQDLARWNTLMESLPWYDFVPSGLGDMRNLIPAGQGTIDDQDWIAAVADGDDGTATTLLAYCPPGADGTFNVDMRVMSGASNLWWWDPTDGTRTLEAGNVANTEASYAVSIPGSNDEGTYDDWVLIAELAVPVTGTGTIALNSLAATASGTETITGTGSVALSQLAASATGAAGAIGTGSLAMSSLGISGREDLTPDGPDYSADIVGTATDDGISLEAEVICRPEIVFPRRS